MLLTVLAGIVAGWSEVGHMLVGQIALNRLTKIDPQAAEKFKTLVLSINTGSLTDGKSSTFRETACWADDLKGTKFTVVNEWHFADSTLVTDSTVPIINYTQAV
jgi:hypothetical protein